MLIPTKHQELKSNTLVLGADILFLLKNNISNLDDLYKKLIIEKNVDLDVFLDAITFLWLINAVNFHENTLSKNKINNDITEDLF